MIHKIRKIHKQVQCPLCKKKKPGSPYRVDFRGESYALEFRGCRYCGCLWQRKKFPFLNSDGYLYLKLYPQTVNDLGLVAMHRAIWEKHNNQKVPDGYVIHHCNGIKTDNTIENLVALPKKEHNPWMARRND